MYQLLERIERTRNIIYNNGDLPCMAIVHCLEDYSQKLNDAGYLREAKACKSVASLLYNFPVYKFDQIYPESIRYGAVIILDRILDDLRS
jgi:hypothetical protein